MSALFITQIDTVNSTESRNSLYGYKDRETTTPLLAHPSPNGWFGGVERLRPLRAASQKETKLRGKQVEPGQPGLLKKRTVLRQQGVYGETAGSGILIRD